MSSMPPPCSLETHPSWVKVFPIAGNRVVCGTTVESPTPSFNSLSRRSRFTLNEVAISGLPIIMKSKID
ncbi:unnamed protein product [Cochlearia groenlandica]